MYPYPNPRLQFDLPQPDPETRQILNHQTGRYIRLGRREFDWLTRLNGQVHRDRVAEHLSVEPAFAEELLRRMEAARLILFSETPVLISSVQSVPEKMAPAPVFEWTQFGQMRLRIPHASRFLSRIASIPLLRNKLFLAATLWISILGIGAEARFIQINNVGALIQNMHLAWLQVVELCAILFMTTVIHELGHAVACTALGAPVRSMGIMIYYLQPAAFADITDSWQLPNRWHRVVISAAGIYAQAVVNALAVIAYAILRANGHNSTLLLIYLGMNFSFMVFNLIPLIKLDGYWMLVNILAFPNLRDRSREWLQAYVRSVVTKKPVTPQTLRYSAILSLSPMARGLLACYAISTNLFALVMWTAGLSFLFRLSRWLGFNRGHGSLYFVGALLLAGAIIFAARILLARRKAQTAAQAVPAPAVATTTLPTPAVRYEIDHSRAIRLNPYVVVTDDRQGTLTFAWASSDQLTVKGSPVLVDILPGLRQGVSLEELRRNGSLTPQAEALLQQLWHSRHVRYSTDWEIQEDEHRYSRQLGWLSFNVAVRGSERAVLARLRSKKITILGVGGVGSNVAMNLAACGIGELHLVDGDTIELSNLNRQLLYRPSDVGRPKVEVARERIMEFNPAIRIRTSHTFLNSVEDIAAVIEGSDFVIRAIDTPVDAQLWVNEACAGLGIPFTGGGFLPQGAVIGPTVVPGVTACLACNREPMPHIDRGIGPSLTPVATVTAGILANEVLTYLGGLGNLRTAGGLILIQVPTFTSHIQKFERDPNCSVCGTRKEVAAV